jgi:hypothetical protein
MSERSDYEPELTTGTAVRISFAIIVMLALVFLAVALLVAP